MAQVTLLLSCLKQSFTELNAFLISNMATAKGRSGALAQNLIDANKENSERLQLLTYHKKLVKQNWHFISKDAQISHFIFYSVFKCRQKDPQEAKREIIKLLSAPVINTFRIFKLLKSSYDTNEMQLAIWFSCLQIERLLTDANTKAICQIAGFIIEKPIDSAQRAIMAECIKKYIPQLKPKFFKVALFLLSCLRPKDKMPALRDIYPFIYRADPDEVYEIFKKCNPKNDNYGYNQLILNVLQTWSAERTKKVCDQIVKIPEFQFDVEQISTTLFENTWGDCLEVLWRFLVDIGDVFAEHKLLSINQKLKAFPCPLNPIVNHPNANFNHPVLLRFTFVNALQEYNEKVLDNLLPQLNMSDAQLQRIYTHCNNSERLKSALYIAKKLPKEPILKFATLFLMALKSNESNDYDAIISREIHEIFDKKEFSLLLVHLQHFPLLAKYALQNSQWKNEVENNLRELVRLGSYLENVDIFVCIDYFEFFELRLKSNPNEPQIHEDYRSTLNQNCAVLLERIFSPEKPSVVFEIMESDKTPATKVEALSKLSKWMPLGNKPQIYSRTTRSNNTLLKSFINNFKLTSTYKSILKDIVDFASESTSKELEKLQQHKIIKLIEVYVGVIDLLSAEKIKALCENSVNKGKEDLLKIILERASLTPSALNQLILKCVIQPLGTKVLCLDLLLINAQKTQGFTFSFEINKYLSNCHTSSHFNLLRTAFLTDDYEIQIYFLFHLLVGLGYKNKNIVKNWPQMNESLGLINPQTLPEATNDIKFNAHLSLLAAIHNKNTAIFISTLDQLDLSDERLTILYHFLLEKQGCEDLTREAYKKLSEESKGKLILRTFEITITNCSSSHSILEHFKEFLKSKRVNSFTENPWNFPQLVEHLVRIPNIAEILDRINCETEHLIAYVIRCGLSEVLKTLLRGESKGKIADTLRNGYERKAFLELEILNNEKKTLLVLLNALHRKGLIVEEQLITLLNREKVCGYKELFTKTFGSLSPETQKEVIKTWGNENTNIVIEMVKSNNHALADLVIPLLNRGNILPLIIRGRSCAVQYISRENRSIFKELLPLIPVTAMDPLRRVFLNTTEHLCCLASIDTKYAHWTPVADMITCLKFCIKKGYDDGFTNYLTIVTLEASQLESLINYALENTNKQAILSTLLIRASRNLKNDKYEYSLARRLVLLHHEFEVIDWMNFRLQSAEGRVHFEKLIKEPPFKKLMFEAANETITHYVRALNLTFQEKIVFLPLLSVKTILSVRKEYLEKGTIRPGHINLDANLNNAHTNMVLPLQSALLEPTSIPNTNEIKARYMELETFLSRIILDDILAATSSTQDNMARFLPYFPSSHQKVLVPLLRENSFNDYLKSQPLDKQAKLLQLATAQQKDDFLKKIGLKHIHIDKWNSDEPVETLSRIILGNEVWLKRTLKQLIKALVNSEETSDEIKMLFVTFLKKVRKALAEVHVHIQKMNAQNNENDNIDFITGEIMKNPVQVIDTKTGAFMTIDQSTALRIKARPQVTGS